MKIKSLRSVILASIVGFGATSDVNTLRELSEYVDFDDDDPTDWDDDDETETNRNRKHLVASVGSRG